MNMHTLHILPITCIHMYDKMGHPAAALLHELLYRGLEGKEDLEKRRGAGH